MAAVKVSAKSDYAVRALLELAVAGEGPVKGERLAQAQEIPLKFLENILSDLRGAPADHLDRGASEPAQRRGRGDAGGRGGRPPASEGPAPHRGAGRLVAPLARWW